MDPGVPVDLHAVWLLETGETLVSGGGGAVLVRSGGTWTSMTTGVGETLTDVWASGPDDIYVAAGHETGSGPSVTVHWDGTEWSRFGISSTPTPAFWGSAADDVYAVVGRTLHHFDGTEWTPLPRGVAGGQIWDLWGAPGGEVFVVGRRGAIAVYAP